MFRFRLQPILCTIVNVVNGMVSGQRSTLGTGLSGEPRCVCYLALLGLHLYSNRQLRQNHHFGTTS